MALRKIRWRQEDYKNLHRAVNHYNKIVEKVKSESLETLVKVDYRDIKSSILTRQGLKEKIARLQRLNEENATTIIRTNEGLRVTKYDFEEAIIADREYKIRLKKDYDFINRPLREVRRDRKLTQATKDYKKGILSSENYQNRINAIQKEYETSQDTETSRFMGWSEARRLEDNLNEDNIDRLMNARDTTQFNEIYQGLMSKSSDDYRMAQAIRYKDYYMKELEQYSSFSNYDKLMERVKNLTPQDFYEFMKQDELAVDLYFQSNQHYSEKEFNNYLRRLGVLPSKSPKIENDSNIEAT